MVKRAKEGQFHPAIALDVAARRIQEQQRHEEEKKHAKPASPISKEKSKKALDTMRGILKKPSEK